MAGTKHFTRMNYHVSRGLREIIAPRQTMPNEKWEAIKKIFEGKCAYCGEGPTRKNRGIVADHVVPATEFGEFVEGNVIPACQTCNDSRGNKNWLEFINSKDFPDLQARIEKIEQYLNTHAYSAPTLETALSHEEQDTYNELVEMWAVINDRAKELYNSKRHGPKT